MEQRLHGAVRLWNQPKELTNIKGTLFLSADDGANGRQFWMTKII